MRALLFPLLLVTACAHLPRRSPTGLTPAAFWIAQQTRVTVLSKISGKLNVRYSGKKQSVSGRGRILVQGPQKVRLELRDPLGRLQYVLTLDGKDMVAYYPSQKTAYLDDRAGTEYLREFMGIDVSLSELESLFVGIIPPLSPRNAFASWDWDPEAGYYRGVLDQTKGQKVTAWVDGEHGALRDLELDSAAEKIRVHYSDFSSCCGGTEAVPLASTVAIELERSKVSMEVEWQDIEALGQPRGAEVFQASLPGDVKKIVLK